LPNYQITLLQPPRERERERERRERERDREREIAAIRSRAARNTNRRNEVSIATHANSEKVATCSR
jgi:hypothetical protein